MSLSADVSGAMEAEAVADVLIRSAEVEVPAPPPRRRSVPLLAALKAAGTEHVDVDTADGDELLASISLADGAVAAEVDGNTVNQPLMQKVLARELGRGDLRPLAAELRAASAELAETDLVPLLYTVLLGRAGNRIVRRLSPDCDWEISLQLHMEVAADPVAGLRSGRALRRTTCGTIVKVPFSPHRPETFLLARDLEREGIPVNFTSTFSARQVVAAALLADVRRTNVFMGRLDQGLEAERLGAHVCLEAQRQLLRLRREDGVATRLIVASVRDPRGVLETAGCDVHTIPSKVLRELLGGATAPGDVTSRLETSDADRLGVSARVGAIVPAERIARLHVVEPELVEFLRDYRRSGEFSALRDPDRLVARFAAAGFGDFFHAPTAAEWQELRRQKVPLLDGALIGRLPLDTHYSLLAQADFARIQEEMDIEIRRAAGL